MGRAKFYLASTGIVLVSIASLGTLFSSRPASAQTIERPIMNAEQCHPLSAWEG